MTKYKQANTRLTTNARSMRKAMTKEELKLWCNFLKQLPISVRRQKVVGNYIVDFYIPSIKLAIELDGSQHYDDKQKEYDNKRTAYLESLGIKVTRYTNLDIRTNFTGVCEDIMNKLDKAKVSRQQKTSPD